MQTQLADWIRDTPEGKDADAHLAQVCALRFLHGHLPDLPAAGRRARRPARPHLPDEADAGRRAVTAKTQLHLDRCLTCRNCETTCPSGVQYGRLVDIGRKLVDDRVQRPLGQRLVRTALKDGLTSPAVRAGDEIRPGCCGHCCRRRCRHKVPATRSAPEAVRRAAHSAHDRAARRLRAAGDGTEHQHRDRARARRARDRTRARRRAPAAVARSATT